MCQFPVCVDILLNVHGTVLRPKKSVPSYVSCIDPKSILIQDVRLYRKPAPSKAPTPSKPTAKPVPAAKPSTSVCIPSLCQCETQCALQKLKSERAMEVDDDDVAPVSASRKRKAKAVVLSDDEDEVKVSPPKKKQATTTAASSKPRASTSTAKADAEGKESKHFKKDGATPRKTATPRKAAAAAAARNKKAKDDDFIASSEEEDDDDDFVMDEDDEELVKKIKGKAQASAKKTPAKATPAKSTPAKSAAKSKAEDKKPAKADDQKSVKAEDTKPAKTEDKAEDKPAKKPKYAASAVLGDSRTHHLRSWYAMKAGRAGPSNPGSKDIPIPSDPNCLAGLSFVFTGELSSLSRDEAIELAKRYGGRVTGQPSSKTSFVVVGADAGPSKLKAIEKNHLKTLDEDDFLNLIATRVTDESNLDDKTRKKIEKEQEAIRQSAKEMERREKQAAKEIAASGV